MAIAVIFDAPGVTQERSDRVLEKLRERGGTLPMKGQLLHLAGPYNDGWRTVDLWEMQEQADAFFREHLAPAFLETGGIPDAPPPQVFPVHDLYT